MGTYSKKTHGSHNHSLTIIITVCQTTLQEGLPFHTTSNPLRFLFGSVWVHETHRQVRALSEELENPMNVHRWRKLEGSDPVMYELIQKVRGTPGVQCRCRCSKLGKCLITTRFFQKKREEGTNRKKMGVQEQELGDIFFGTPNLNNFFKWIFGELQPICSSNDWEVIC